MMGKVLSISLAVFLFSAPIKTRPNRENLPPRYNAWLNEDVAYIIGPRENEAFARLQTDKERDHFIEAFWKHRDPTLGTPENEFRSEHYRRIMFRWDPIGKGTQGSQEWFGVQ
jgi:hypothetical protein